MGLMGWLMKGIGFEDEEDQEAEAIKLEHKAKKQKLKEAKRKEKEAAKLERTNAKLSKISERGARITPEPTEPVRSANLDQFNISGQSRAAEQENNYGGYGSDYGADMGGNVGGYGSKNVVFFYPKTYAEAQRLIDYIKQGESVMLNLDDVSEAEAQRMLDFASGAIYAVNGSIQRVSGNIFLLTPEGLNIVAPKK